tara:strand:- start:16206 stop:19736 length:3531 start_codon:yes stop_codon:yes gene_type:complete
MTLPADGKYHLNNDRKPWKIHAQTVTSRAGESLLLKSSDNYNLFLDASGATVSLNNNLLVTENSVTFGAGTVFSGNLVTDSSAVQIPITLNNYEFANHITMLTNLTTTPNVYIDLTSSGYSVPFTPRSVRSKIYIRMNISYISSNESEQLISFRLNRRIGSNAASVIFSDEDIGTLMGVSNAGIYTGDFIDTPNTTSQLTYFLSYKIANNSNISIDVNSGVLGYDDNNTNFFMAQELYVPPTDVTTQTGVDGQPLTFAQVLGSGLNSTFNNTSSQNSTVSGMLTAASVDINGGNIDGVVIGNHTRNNAYFNNIYGHQIARFYDNMIFYDIHNNEKIVLTKDGNITIGENGTTNGTMIVHGTTISTILSVTSSATLHDTFTSKNNSYISTESGYVELSKDGGHTVIKGNLTCNDVDGTSTFNTLVSLQRTGPELHLDVAGSTDILTGSDGDLNNRQALFRIAPNQTNDDNRFHCHTGAVFNKPVNFVKTGIIQAGLNITHTSENNGNAISINNGIITMHSTQGKITCKNLEVSINGEDTFTTNGYLTSAKFFNSSDETNLATAGKLTKIRGTLQVDETSLFVNDVVLGESSLLKPNGGIEMDSDKFKVANNSGNTTIAGTLDVNGAVNLASTGVATTVEGNLQVNQTSSFTGNVTLGESSLLKPNGGIEMDSNKFKVANNSGNTTIAGTLDVNGEVNLASTGVATTVEGILQVNETSTFNNVVKIKNTLELYQSNGDSNSITKLYSQNVNNVGQLTIDPHSDGATGHVIIAGNLTVQGTTTSINSNEVNIGDSIIKLNSDYNGNSPSENAGLEINRGDQPNSFLIWDESNDRWTIRDQNNSGQNLYTEGSITCNQLLKNGGGVISGTISNATNAVYSEQIKIKRSGHNANCPITFIQDYANNEMKELKIDDGNNLSYNASSNTLNVSNISGFSAQGDINFNSKVMTNVNITSGTIVSSVISGNVSGSNESEKIRTNHSNDDGDYPITFIHNHGNDVMQELKVDGGNNITYNPQTNRLNVLNIGGFTAQGGINFNNQSMTNVNIDSGKGMFSRLEAQDDSWTKTGGNASTIHSGNTLELNMNNDMVQSQTINITHDIHKINVSNGRDGCQLIVSATFNANHTIYGGPSPSRDNYETSNVYIGFKDDIEITDKDNQRVVFSIIKCHGKYYVTAQQYWYT